MTCDYLEYDGTKTAKAWGSVLLNRGNVELKTDTLYLDRKILKLIIILLEPF